MRLLGFLLLASVIVVGCDKPGIPSTDRTVTFQPNSPSPHWTVINYWAKWCAPCRDEIPELNEFARHTAQQVQVLGVNYDQLQGKALLSDIAALGIEFPVLLRAPHAELGLPQPNALPATVVIKPDGQVSTVLLGPQTGAGLREATVGAR